MKKQFSTNYPKAVRMIKGGYDILSALNYPNIFHIKIMVQRCAQPLHDVQFRTKTLLSTGPMKIRPGADG